MKIILISITAIILLSSCNDIAPQRKVNNRTAKLSCGITMHGDNEYRVFYKTPSVIRYTFCEYEQQTRTCNNGTFNSWTGTFKYESCTVNDNGDFPSSRDISAHNDTKKSRFVIIPQNY
jgi:hypothetical protein